MKQTEVRDSLFNVEKELYILSQEIAQGLEEDGLDNTYLSSKVQGVINVSNHIKGQLDFKK